VVKGFLQGLLDIYRVQHQLIVYGNTPVPLYRSFSKREYAEEFCSGLVRFQTLDSYKRIEDSDRIDSTEGVGEINIPGEQCIVNLEEKTLTSIPGTERLVAPASRDSHFIYCLSSPVNGSYNPELQKFGLYVVKIGNPLYFLKSLAVAIQQDSTLNANPPFLESGKVIYDKFSEYSCRPNKSKIDRIRWLQKPNSFKPEREFRIHFQVCTPKPITSNDVYYVQLGQPINSCEIIEIQS